MISLDSLVAKTLACRAGVPGSIPGRGVYLHLLQKNIFIHM